MTTAEAWALIRDSAPFKAANGDLAETWKRWRAANPHEAVMLLAYTADSPTAIAPSLGTKYGRGMVALVTAREFALVPTAVAAPPPVVTPPPPAKPVLGAMVVNAGNCSPDLLRQAGVTHVAPEILGPNLVDLATARWDGFVRGGMFISRGGDTVNEVNHAATIAGDNRLSFLVIDTEAHKADQYPRLQPGDRIDPQYLAWTEGLYAGLRARWPALPLYNVTFGIHSSPAVVNHEAFRKHNVTPIWEAYDGDGATLGVDPTADKAIIEGWNPPHVAIGDKSVAADATGIDIRLDNKRPLGGVWLWAVEQSGTDVLALKGIFG